MELIRRSCWKAQKQLSLRDDATKDKVCFTFSSVHSGVAMGYQEITDMFPFHHGRQVVTTSEQNP